MAITKALHLQRRGLVSVNEAVVQNWTSVSGAHAMANALAPYRRGPESVNATYWDKRVWGTFHGKGPELYRRGLASVNAIVPNTTEPIVIMSTLVLQSVPVTKVVVAK